MTNMTRRLALLPALVLTFAGLSSAAVIGGDFYESLDLPDFSVGARILSRTGVVFPSAGPHLTDVDETQNPSAWTNMLLPAFNAGTNVLSLVADGSNNYQVITFTLSNLTFDNGMQVVGIAPLSTGNAVTGAFTMNTSFTANSVTITYTADGLGSSGNFFINPQADLFELQLGTTATPEPGTIVLAGAGLLAVFATRRRKQ